MIAVIFGFSYMFLNRTYFSIVYEVDFFAVIDHSIASAYIYSAVAAQLAVPFVREHSAVEIGALYFGIFLTALFYERSYGSIQNLECPQHPKRSPLNMRIKVISANPALKSIAAIKNITEITSITIPDILRNLRDRSAFIVFPFT